MAVLRRADALAGVVAVSLGACGTVESSSVSGVVPSPKDACAVVGPLSSATGVGPMVIFVTRGRDAQDACEAELHDPRNRNQGLSPAYVPTGTPACTYLDSHDPPPEGGRTYEIYGSGASVLCDSIHSHPSAGAATSGGEPGG